MFVFERWRRGFAAKSPWDGEGGENKKILGGCPQKPQVVVDSV
jgi:hypothetical protein